MNPSKGVLLNNGDDCMRVNFDIQRS